jgi:hypothetical protein
MTGWKIPKLEVCTVTFEIVPEATPPLTRALGLTVGTGVMRMSSPVVPTCSSTYTTMPGGIVAGSVSVTGPAVLMSTESSSTASPAGV